MRGHDLAQWLFDPPLTAAPERLASVWRRTSLSVRIHRPEGFDFGPWNAAILRGALGHALIRMATSDPEAAMALEFLFRLDLRPTPGRSIPVPLVVAVDPQGRDLLATLTLFGFADAFRRAVFDAFLDALSHGVALGAGSHRLRRPFEVTSADWSRSERVEVPRAAGSVRLVFETPVRPGPRRALSARWDDLLVGLADRVGRLARWQGLAVDMRLGERRERSKRLVFRDDAMFPVAWDRRTGRQSGRRVPMAGLMGSLDIDGVGEDLLALFAIGETCHAGAHTALGLGRYRLIC